MLLVSIERLMFMLFDLAKHKAFLLVAKIA